MCGIKSTTVQKYRILTVEKYGNIPWMRTREVLEKTGLKPGMCRKKQHGGRAARQRVSGRQSSVSVKSGNCWQGNGPGLGAYS